MYNPIHNQIQDQAACVDFMRANAFATLVSMLNGDLFASHLPLITHASDGRVSILGHFAKANPHWRAFESEPAPCLVIFSGPHAFVSPSSYTLNHGIPTWNYIAVHAYGTAKISHSPKDKLSMLHDLHTTIEPANEAAFAAQPAAFQQAQLNGIVWFEVNVTRLEGKAKLSQHHTLENQRGAAEWLEAQPDPSAQEIGRLMHANIESPKP